MSLLFILLLESCILTFPSSEILLSTTSDLANVGFTSAGFVLTFLTLLVSFKSSSKPYKRDKDTTLEESYNATPMFDLFLSSTLYNETIRHLKNGVKELIVVALIGYTLKLSIPQNYIDYLFYFNISSLAMITIVLWRSLLVLAGVLKVQDQN